MTAAICRRISYKFFYMKCVSQKSKMIPKSDSGAKMSQAWSKLPAVPSNRKKEVMKLNLSSSDWGNYELTEGR